MTKIEEIWNNFESDDSMKIGIVRKRFSPEIIPDCFVAMRMPEKVKSIAVRLSTSLVNLTALNDLKGIKTEILPDELNSSKSLLLISLAENSLSSIFAVLCQDLFNSVSSITEEDKLVISLQNRFLKWKELFVVARGSGLTPSKQVGLFGEIYLLLKIIENSGHVENSLNIWVGPDTGIRDFEINSTAIEVKTTQTNNHQKLHITSERQLDTSLLENLYLFHLSLEKRNSSEYTLNTIIEDAFSIIGDNRLLRNIFKRKLINVGYFDHHKSKYEDITYLVRDEDFYSVFDSFPRIEESDLLKGVGDVKYTIVLTSETERYKTEFNTILNKLAIS